MKERCLNPKSAGYPRYGGRGIKVCERWLNSFPAFLDDMGRRPSAIHSIDRYPDNDGDYCPENCRWATPTEQMNNRSNSIRLEIDGRSLTIAEFADECGVDAGTIYGRIQRGVPTEELGKKPSEGKRYSDPFYRTPISKRDAAWYREYERRESEP